MTKEKIARAKLKDRLYKGIQHTWTSTAVNLNRDSFEEVTNYVLRVLDKELEKAKREEREKVVKEMIGDCPYTELERTARHKMCSASYNNCYRCIANKIIKEQS